MNQLMSQNSSLTWANPEPQNWCLKKGPPQTLPDFCPGLLFGAFKPNIWAAQAYGCESVSPSPPLTADRCTHPAVRLKWLLASKLAEFAPSPSMIPPPLSLGCSSPWPGEKGNQTHKFSSGHFGFVWGSFGGLPKPEFLGWCPSRLSASLQFCTGKSGRGVTRLKAI